MAVSAKRPTSRDVACLAGVSQTTVSLVINDVPTAGITPETRDRVKQAIASLDYYPHEGARSLSRRATHTIGVAIPDAGNPHYLEITEAIEAFAVQRHYSIVLIVTNYDINRELRCLQWLKQQRMDALIICPSTGEQFEAEIRAARVQGYQVTTFQENVLPPLGTGERPLFEHLAALGHRRIGYVYGVASQEWFADRLRSCLQAQASLGLPVEEQWIARCGPSIDDGFQATHELLSRCSGEHRPTALIVVNDLLAMGVIAALNAAGIVVPEQMSVAAFDNTRLARYISPPLTSVDPEAHTMGENIARIAFDRLTAPDKPPIRCETVTRLIIRQSTGPAPKP
jgi:DNA-binding LacI/PurR family transcriptional regulator